MQKRNIDIVSEKIKFRLKNKIKVLSWIDGAVKSQKKTVGNLCYVFCSDSYLLKLNQLHLKHNTYTDIITFDYTEGEIVSGDMFISVDRVKENAKNLGIKFDHELHRVMIHGVLHLLGMKDKNEAQKKQMRKAENKYLLKLKTK